MVGGLAHPVLFSQNSFSGFSYFDYLKVFGATPVTSSNFYGLLSTKSHILLYPGGAREALHRKGEEYKLFWPDQPEFVRMVAKFGATIVPFGVVGEDDIALFCLNLGMNNQAMKAAQEAVQKSEKFDIRRSPISIAAAIINIRTQLSDKKKPLRGKTK